MYQSRSPLCISLTSSTSFAAENFHVPFTSSSRSSSSSLLTQRASHCRVDARSQRPLILTQAVPEREAQTKPDSYPESPLEALKAAVTEGNAALSYRDADENEEETWEDLLEMEENMWDPHAAQADTLTELLERPIEGVSQRPAIQDVPTVTMATLHRWVDAGADFVCIVDVSPSTSNPRSGAVAAAARRGVRVVHVPLEALRAEAAEQLRQFKHVVVVSSAMETGPALNHSSRHVADIRCWQACIRLRRVYGLEKASILDDSQGQSTM